MARDLSFRLQHAEHQRQRHEGGNSSCIRNEPVSSKQNNSNNIGRYSTSREILKFGLIDEVRKTMNCRLAAEKDPTPEKSFREIAPESVPEPEADCGAAV